MIHHRPVACQKNHLGSRRAQQLAREATADSSWTDHDRFHGATSFSNSFTRSRVGLVSDHDRFHVATTSSTGVSSGSPLMTRSAVAKM